MGKGEEGGSRGGRRVSDRKKICLFGGSGMKLKREKRGKNSGANLRVISCDVKVGRWRGKEFEGNISV